LHVNKDETKALTWKYVGYTDLRLQIIDFYFRKIEMDLKSRSKKMDIYEIFNQLKQTKFDASKAIQVSKEFSFTGKRPCYSSTIADGGRFVMMETAKKIEDTSIKLLMKDTTFKKDLDLTCLTEDERL